MIRLLAAAPLITDPVERVAKTGAPYVTFSLRTDECGIVNCIAFDKDCVAELVRLRKGDSVSVAGRCEFREWTDKHGMEKAGLGCTVDKVMTATAKPKEKKREPAPEPQPLKPWPAGTDVTSIPDDRPF